MFAAGVAVGQIGIGTLHPHGKVGGHKQVKNAVNAIGRNTLAPRCRNQLGYIIGRCRARETGKRLKDSGARVGPLLPGFLQIMACSIGKRFAVMLMMLMFSHQCNLGMMVREGKFIRPQAPGSLCFTSSAGRAHPRPWLRANKARRPVGLASLRSVWGNSLTLLKGRADPTRSGGKRDRAPELMRGKPRARMRPPGA